MYWLSLIFCSFWEAWSLFDILGYIFYFDFYYNTQILGVQVERTPRKPKGIKIYPRYIQDTQNIPKILIISTGFQNISKIEKIYPTYSKYAQDTQSIPKILIIYPRYSKYPQGPERYSKETQYNREVRFGQNCENSKGTI